METEIIAPAIAQCPIMAHYIAWCAGWLSTLSRDQELLRSWWEHGVPDALAELSDDSLLLTQARPLGPPVRLPIRPCAPQPRLTRPGRASLYAAPHPLSGHSGDGRRPAGPRALAAAGRAQPGITGEQ